jgi:hypothetical protein
MKLSRQTRGVLIGIALVVGILMIYYWAIPSVASHFLRSYDAYCRTLEVSAKYYPLTIDGIDSAYLSNGRLVAKGYDVWFFHLYPQPLIDRSLPEPYAGITIPDTSWHLMDTLTSVTGVSSRVLLSTSSGDSIRLQLPAGNDYPRLAVYRGVAGDTILIVLGSGNWKRGCKAHLGYVACWRKRS